MKGQIEVVDKFKRASNSNVYSVMEFFHEQSLVQTAGDNHIYIDRSFYP